MADLSKILEEIKSLTVKDLNDLVKGLEDEFGVSAAMMAAPVAGGATAGGGDTKSEYAVHLAETGNNKMAVIKIVKEFAGLGLKEAKELADNAPKLIKENVPDAEAQEIKKKLEEAGAKVELK